MAGIADWIHALHTSQDRFGELVSALDGDTVGGPSFDPGWSIADVASHLGSQAEIFELALEAGLSGGEVPGNDQIRPIWDRWNAKAPAVQVSDSVQVGERFVVRMEQTGAAERESFSVELFGSHADLARLAAMRLGEQALHTWDVAVALDPSATVLSGAVELLVDTLPALAARAGRPAPEPRTVTVLTTEPVRRLTLTTGPDVTLEPADDEGAEPDLTLPAEALLRLVYGRLDPEHTPRDVAGAPLLAELRPVFPGF
ncbi:maleylpyruvate isomerase family mycothiol-dependent enzyme [Leekyejoonella antrihumi]|uniref:Maleylpyruvate isomerase family mycothiol-dependent enzyme n=1 Tax=Leekyejoonella antrihumi TaxID=1660198 RepID=A0A563E7Q0_9MICO|nr:maleylpyruvate isomerase family mycothiol-dependent enzyme [Leekyejoonella antrihumi]TWP38556.1 maleylpyruvate isomerase family mycothiol-dependent enzyme [Leekyejoonella antrihumi]